MGSFLNGFPDHIQRFKPAICRGFITHLSPNSLLGIEPRLVRRKVLQVDTFVCPHETANLFAFMPGGAIYIQPDRVAPQSAIHLAETGEESFSVALRGPQHCHPAQQRGNPAKNIQPLVMLAGGGDSQRSADFAPASAQSRMQSKTGLIFKNNGLLSSQRPEFFLTCDETFWHPRFFPADSYSRRSSSGILADASTIAPDVLSAVFQIDFSGAPLRSDHPTGLDSDQTPQATSLNVFPTHGALAGSAALVVQAFLPVLGIANLDHLPCASTDSSSDGLNPALRLSIPDADPPMSAKEPQSLFQQGPPGFAELLATNRLGSRRDAPTSDLVFA
jgi:hypothetical protein